jgi:hypothetical protein
MLVFLTKFTALAQTGAIVMMVVIMQNLNGSDMP